jgi:putative iron-regulated protein
MTTLRDRAENKGIAYDQMIGENNPVGNAIVQAAVDALVAQTRSIERAAGVLGVDGLQLSGSDSLDNPSAVFK